MNKYNQYLSNLLIGTKLQYISRSCDLIMLGFGEMIMRTNRKGLVNHVAEFSLHIQTPFRIIQNNNIIIAYNDIFLPGSKKISDFDFTQADITLFDCKIKQNYEKLFKTTEVESIIINDKADMEIYFKNNIEIQLFISESCSNEVWRFFETDKSDSHLVANGSLITFE